MAAEAKMDKEHDDGSVTIELDDDKDQLVVEEDLKTGGAVVKDGVDVGDTGDDDDDDEDRQGQAQETAGQQTGDHRSKTEENRNRRQQRKQARLEREERMKRENDALRNTVNTLTDRINTIEQRSNGADVAQLDVELRRTSDAYNYFKSQIADATVSTDPNRGTVVAEATEKMVAARARFDELNRVKQAVSSQSRQPHPLDPMLKSHADSWMAKNRWYDPGAQDTDSRIVFTLDQQLANEGWNPRTPEYWAELDRRAQKYLPHRYDPEYDKGHGSGDRGQQQSTAGSPRSVVTGSGQERGSGGVVRAGGSYTISAERVKALKDAGMWDDPKKRASAIRRFREYDRAHNDQSNS
jgi:hypothetical protein